jgi:hypothetical protein
MDTAASLRFFVGHSNGQLDCIEVPSEVEEAMDIMLAGKVNEQKAAELAWAAYQSNKDPVEFAHHFVKLVKALHQEDHV